MEGDRGKTRKRKRRMRNERSRARSKKRSWRKKVISRGARGG